MIRQLADRLTIVYPRQETDVTSSEQTASNRRILFRSGAVLLLAAVSNSDTVARKPRTTQKRRKQRRNRNRNHLRHRQNHPEQGVHLETGSFLARNQISVSNEGFNAHKLLSFQTFTTEEKLAHAVAEGERLGLYLLPDAQQSFDVFGLTSEAEAKKKKPRKGSRKWCKNHKNHHLCQRGFPSPGGDNPTPTPDPGDGLKIRRNIAEYTSSEMQQLVDRLNTLKASGRYDEYVSSHFAAMDVAHSGALFFPWHRQFILNFENDLGVILPYWRWEQGIPAGLLDPNGFGSDGDPGNNNRVTGVPFGHWHALIYDAGANSLVPRSFQGLVRVVGRGSTSSLPTPGDIEMLMGIGTYDGGSFDRSSPYFRNRAEGWGDSAPQTHNRSHTYIGGDLSAATSPNDPLFFLLHANIDRIWWNWQQVHGLTNYQGPPGQGLHDPMPHLRSSTTPQHVMDIRTLGYTYA